MGLQARAWGYAVLRRFLYGLYADLSILPSSRMMHIDMHAEDRVALPMQRSKIKNRVGVRIKTCPAANKLHMELGRYNSANTGDGAASLQRRR